MVSCIEPLEGFTQGRVVIIMSKRCHVLNACFILLKMLRFSGYEFELGVG